MFKKASLALAIATALSVNSVHAGQLDSSNFTVRATITGSCTTVTPQSLFNFGSMLGTNTNVDGTMTVNVTCSNLLPYNLAISYGQSGTFNRAMTDGASHTLSYQLFTDSNRTINFADPTGNAAAMISGTGTGSSQTLTVYGRVPVQVTPVPGVYNDTLVASVIW